jgi:hypothetical protein
MSAEVVVDSRGMYDVLPSRVGMWCVRESVMANRVGGGLGLGSGRFQPYGSQVPTGRIYPQSWRAVGLLGLVGSFVR